MPEIDTHNLICNFGRRFKGKLWTRIDADYLRWIVNEKDIDPSVKDIASAELKRRGTKIPTVQLSPHAIDRFSERYLSVFINYRSGGGEHGLYTWLSMAAAEAHKHVDREGKGKHMGMTFVFKDGAQWPIVKTVM